MLTIRVREGWLKASQVRASFLIRIIGFFTCCPVSNADYVRLHAGLAPPHWHRAGGDRWDAGYDTTGYFLDWLEQQYHGEIVKQLNAAMNGINYNQLIFTTATGHPVEELWRLYCAQFEEKQEVPQGEIPECFDMCCLRIKLTSYLKTSRIRTRRRTVR
jgi:Peptidase of plants and bacteria